MSDIHLIPLDSGLRRNDERRVFNRRVNNIKYTGSLDEFKNLRIGFIMGFSYGDRFDNADYLIKDPALNPKILIKKLLAGRNDVAAENQTVIEGNALKMDVLKKSVFFRLQFIIKSYMSVFLNP